MEENLKQLLLRDLSARLPYGVHLRTSSTDDAELLDVVRDLDYDEQYWINGYYDIEEIKPYLRPISSMTDEEVDKLFEILKINESHSSEWLKVNDVGIIRLFTQRGKDFYEIADAFDYLYSIHIDFRGLIQKGLALKAPKGMYNIKTK